jgi:hypothetical protein
MPKVARPEQSLRRQCRAVHVPFVHQITKTTQKTNVRLLLVLLFDKFPLGQLAASRFSSLSGRLDV